jgi:hypothetical protein
MVSLEFFFRSRYVRRVESAYKRNKYQECLLGGKSGWCLGLKTLPPQLHGTLRACTSTAFRFMYMFFELDTKIIRVGNVRGNLTPRWNTLRLFHLVYCEIPL